MSWNYRVMRHREKDTVTGLRDYFAIHEVYTDPSGWTENPVTVGGDSVEEIRETLKIMTACLNAPIMDYEEEQ